MAEIKSQIARRELVSTVASYDSSILSRKALDDSVEFNSFLDKTLRDTKVDWLDMVAITEEIEIKLDIIIPEFELTDTWRQFFDKIVELLNEV